MHTHYNNKLWVFSTKWFFAGKSCSSRNWRKKRVSNLSSACFSNQYRQHVRLKFCAWEMRNDEVASINSNNLSRFVLLPELCSSYSFNLQEKTLVKRLLAAAFWNKVTFMYIRLIVHTEPVSCWKTSWLGLDTLISNFNCCLRFLSCWRVTLDKFLKLS